jgi:hypothetical protein
MKQIPERQGNHPYFPEQRGFNDTNTLEASLEEILQYNARLREIVTELLIKNQNLRWAIRAGEKPGGPIREQA